MARAMARTPSPEAVSFEQRLPQRTEHFEVGIPRGLRVSSSLRVAGKIAVPSRDAETTTELNVPVKTYKVTVEPRSRKHKIKEVMRQKSRPVSTLDWYDQQDQQCQQEEQRQAQEQRELREAQESDIDEAPAEASVQDKQRFRRERMRTLDVSRRFPALVNPKLAPNWARRNGKSPSSGRRSPDANPKERIVLPTVSMAGKRQPKSTVTSPRAWMHGTPSQAQQLISDRLPALFEDPYDGERNSSFEEHQANKDRHLGAPGLPMLPSPRSNVEATSHTRKKELEDEIATGRARGREHKEALQMRYESKRDCFIRDRDAVRLRRGCASPFDAARKKHHQEEERALELLREQQEADAKRKKEAIHQIDAESRLSIGFSRFRTEG